MYNPIKLAAVIWRMILTIMIVVCINMFATLTHNMEGSLQGEAAVLALDDSSLTYGMSQSIAQFVLYISPVIWIIGILVIFGLWYSLLRRHLTI